MEKKRILKLEEVTCMYWRQLAPATMPACIVGMIFSICFPFMWLKVIGVVLISMVLLVDLLLLFGMFVGQIRGELSCFVSEKVWCVYAMLFDSGVFALILAVGIFKWILVESSVVYWVSTVGLCLVFLWLMFRTCFKASWENA